MRNVRFCKVIRGSHAPLALLSGVLMLAGCATSNPPADRSANPSAHESQTEPTSVVRYGRYRLVELTPSPAQQDLMEQIVDVAIPTEASATVGGALRYVLLRSGYRLCDEPAVANRLEALPLPAAHVQLGPLALRRALEVLVGPAWQLIVDDAARRVCFTPLGKSAPEGSFMMAPAMAPDACDDELQTIPLPAISDERSAAPMNSSLPADLRLIDPPFTPLGIELHGSEFFLLLRPFDAQSLSEVHKLRPGDAAGDWQLQALGAHTAEFKIDGQIRRIVLP